MQTEECVGKVAIKAKGGIIGYWPQSTTKKKGSVDIEVYLPSGPSYPYTTRNAQKF